MTIIIHLGFWTIPTILMVFGQLYAALAPAPQGQYGGISVFGRLIATIGLCLAMWDAYSCFTWRPSGGWQFSFLALAIAGTVIGGAMIARAVRLGICARRSL